ncbi:MAG: glycine zipper 2TM domain-containing protein [Betaproteobacteria bacterium]|nr:glycine zipper 2TM domain-containing protein [Betaproteobacteria bacterium]
MTEPTSKTSPFVIAASIAVIIASIVAVGSMTGLIPGNTPKTETPAATTPAQTAAMNGTAATPVKPAGTMEKSAPPAVEKPLAAQPEPAAKSVKKQTAKTAAVKQAPQPVATETGRMEKPVAANVCANCGTIAAVRVVEQAGEGSGLGAVAGGVVGGLLGNQVGAGTGKDLATIAGAIGGGYAGHQIEKKAKTTKHYEISVRMDDGSHRTFMQETEPVYAIGEKVKIIDGALTRN